MNTNNAIKTSIMNTIFTFTLCFASTVALAESGHGDEKEHDEGEGHIELSQEQIKHAGISLSQVDSSNIRETLPVYGVITRNAEQVQSVSARFEGVIRSVKKSIGDQVRKGDVLVTVEANESFKTYSVLSALKGVITQRNVNIGEQTADRAIFVIEDFSTVWVDLSLFPEDVSKVKLGQSVRIKSANNAISGEGNVIFISPLGNSNNQSTTVRVLLSNENNMWKPGLFVKADITLSETLASTAILSEAVQLVEGKTIIFVKGEEGFEPREIILGRSDGEFSEVLSGLNAGETYVAKNSFVLKSEMGKGDAEHGH
tara:strand:- start:3088 stop:4029 length:942 start_codon:yes stop_codon:yes gene_type:complete